MNRYISINSIIFSFVLMLCTIPSLSAQDYRQTFGVRLGTYIGASFAFSSENRSIEAVAGITRQANQTDYIFGGFYKFHSIVSSDMPTLNWYFGLGAFLFLEYELGTEKVNVAPSAITGLEYTLEHAPVNFFIDVAPHFNITTEIDTKFNIHANLGVRYILNRKE